MRFQFGTKAILLATAFVAIACSGLICLHRLTLYHSNSPWIAINYGLLGAPIWIPVVFASNAIGRRQITFGMLIGFALAEVAAFAAIYVFPAFLNCWIYGGVPASPEKTAISGENSADRQNAIIHRLMVAS
jgi:hypothetical protein